MQISRQKFEITTDASGDFTDTGPTVPKQPVHDTGGQELQGSDFLFSASDRLRVNITEGGASRTGTLYVWTGW